MGLIDTIEARKRRGDPFPLRQDERPALTRLRRVAFARYRALAPEGDWRAAMMPAARAAETELDRIARCFDLH